MTKQRPVQEVFRFRTRREMMMATGRDYDRPLPRPGFAAVGHKAALCRTGLDLFCFGTITFYDERRAYRFKPDDFQQTIIYPVFWAELFNVEDARVREAEWRMSNYAPPFTTQEQWDEWLDRR